MTRSHPKYKWYDYALAPVGLVLMLIERIRNFKLLIILLINLVFCALLLTHPSSGFYKVWEKDVIAHYEAATIPDIRTYTDPPEKDSLRTVGYPLLLNLIMKADRWIFILLAFNCLMATWFFYVTEKLIGIRVWILFFLGLFTLYVPMILTDMLFAAIFVTAIWQIKRLWLHFTLLGVASLFNPALAWFFVIEPFVLYFNGYKSRKLLFASLIIAFAVTSFNPIRNLINTGQWTHSTVMLYNIDHYFTGIGYFFKAFYYNAILPHSHYIIGKWTDVLLIAVNVGLWGRFLVRMVQNKVNWGYVLILIYILGPTLFATPGPRKMLPIEWILLF